MRLIDLIWGDINLPLQREEKLSEDMMKWDFCVDKYAYTNLEER